MNARTVSMCLALAFVACETDGNGYNPPPNDRLDESTRQKVLQYLESNSLDGEPCHDSYTLIEQVFEPVENDGYWTMPTRCNDDWTVDACYRGFWVNLNFCGACDLCKPFQKFKDDTSPKQLEQIHTLKLGTCRHIGWPEIDWDRYQMCYDKWYEIWGTQKMFEECDYFHNANNYEPEVNLPTLCSQI